MKKIGCWSIAALLLIGGTAGWFFGSRWYYTDKVNFNARSLEKVARECQEAVAQKQTYIRVETFDNDLKWSRERYGGFPQWAVSGQARDRFTAAEKEAEQAIADLKQFIADDEQRKRDAEQQAAQLAEEEHRKNREADAAKNAEAKRKADADRKKINDAVSATHLPAGTQAAGAGWPLADPWPNDLKPAKVLIWDQKKEQIHSAQEKLPEHLRGSPDDAELLICAVMHEHLQPVVEYKQDPFRRKHHWESDATISGKIAGHRMWQSVRLVRYPANERIGSYTIVGDEPRSEVYVATNKEDRKVIVGDYEPLLAKWLAGRFAAAGPAEKFLAASQSAEAAALAEEIGQDWKLVGPAILPYLAKKLPAATDPAMQFAVIRVVQAVKQEPPDYVPPSYRPGEGPAAGEPPPRPPNIGPPNYAAFVANPRRWLNNINDWLKVQAPIEP